MEAASGRLEVAADHHEPIPASSAVEALRRNRCYADCLWVTVEVEIERPGT